MPQGPDDGVRASLLAAAEQALVEVQDIRQRVQRLEMALIELRRLLERRS